MSELKAFDVGLGQYCEDGSPCVVAFDADRNPRLLDDEKVYLKSEADKVIADLEMKLAMAQQVLRLNKPEALFSNLDTMSRLSHEINVVERRERHQKYKRCLDKAEMCKARYDEEDAKVNGYGASWEYISEEMKYWERWEKRWLELAEHYKEAK